ncbi:hypothetical protein DSECCO2_213190 [anaerobic digester metagenome]
MAGIEAIIGAVTAVIIIAWLGIVYVIPEISAQTGQDFPWFIVALVVIVVVVIVGAFLTVFKR